MSLKTLQINVNRSLPTTEHVLQLAIELNISILAIQEPWTIKDNTTTSFRSINHSSFRQVLPNYGSFRPRVIFYILNNINITLAPNSPQDPDCIIIDIAEYNIQLINIYNATYPNIPNSTITLLRPGIIPNLLANKTILLGDFNIHHPWWDPLAQPSPNSDILLDLIENYNLSLLNNPGEGTFYRPNMATPSVLDLTFASQGIVNKIEDWQILPDLGSDHFGVLFTIIIANNNISTSSSRSRFDTKRADWKLFKSWLKTQFLEFEFKPGFSYPTPDLDYLGELFTSTILEAANKAIPRISITANSKPWWNEDLKSLRKTMQRFYRKNKASGYNLYKEELKEAKNVYFNTIKLEKQKHWNKFLEKEDSQSIFKAMSYTKNSSNSIIPSLFNQETNRLESTFQDKCNIFKSTLFPEPPYSLPINISNYRSNKNWDWPLLSRIELDNACTTKIKGKTPGPDLITQEIIVQAYSAIPDIFYIVYSLLINQGYHPKVWKQATGFILKKPKKPDYSKPKAYRVISLLNCLGKISERILARRLSYLAETTILLHNSQLGSRLKKSAIDTALLLKNEVELNKTNKLKTTALFLDVKGAFDHVSKNRLIQILANLKLPLSLINWISSFLADRTIRLTFDNNIEEFKPISTGIPQGSPISPILFLIYIRDLFKNLNINIKPLSYMDDISLIASSKSFKQNIGLLEREATKLINLGKDYSISFDIEKTELIHFYSGKSNLSLVLPNQAKLAPSKLVKWLGINFDSVLSFKEHRSIRTSLAKQMFYRVNRLSSINTGLSFHAIRQLYIACVTSVSDYGSILWWGSKKINLRLLQSLQNLALRKILGVFKTAPILPMELEAMLPPPNIRLNHINRRYMLRILKLSNNHPIKIEVDKAISKVQENMGTSLTQIESLVKSIATITDFTSLETIKHFYFSPWNKEIPYKTIISKLSKEEEAIAHLHYINSCSTMTTSIYTDGSQTLDGFGVGYGLTAYKHSSDLSPKISSYSQIGNLGISELVYNSELEAITQAIEYASNIAKEGESFNIFSDNQAAILRLKTPSDNPGQNQQIRAIEASKAIISLGANITIRWVPGHSDILGNEEADRLAKLATKEPANSNITSFAMLGTKISQLKKAEIRAIIASKLKTKTLATYSSHFTCKVATKLLIPRGTIRLHSSSFFQLKLGHGYIKSYLYRIGLIPNRICICGSIETTSHLLLNCRDYKEQRAILAKGILDELGTRQLNLSLIMHTEIGIRHLLVFLKETNICTRNWYQIRQQSLEDELRDFIL
jgi:ribonuclease HI